MKQPHMKRDRHRPKGPGNERNAGPKLIGEKRKSISLEFNMNDPDQKALYRMLQGVGDVNAFLLRMLKLMSKRIRSSRSREKTPWTDKVLDQIKREVELEEEKDAMRPVFFQTGKK
ncbi:MAG: hypothetical protein ACXVPK_03340 [Tumebacillaceae bacterium]